MNLSVLIGTCDKYSPLWKSFQITFNRYWEHDTQNIFVGENKKIPQYTTTKFHSVLNGFDEWGSRMRAGIELCDSDYILFLLEDYLLYYKYSKPQLETWVSDMIRLNINRLQISPSGFQIYNKIDGIPYEQISPMSDYLISMQPSIWKRDFLLEQLLPELSPWEFEINQSLKLKGNENNTFVDRTIPNVYFNAVRRGFIKSKGWDEFRIKENLDDF